MRACPLSGDGSSRGAAAPRRYIYFSRHISTCVSKYAPSDRRHRRHRRPTGNATGRFSSSVNTVVNVSRFLRVAND